MKFISKMVELVKIGVRLAAFLTEVDFTSLIFFSGRLWLKSFLGVRGVYKPREQNFGQSTEKKCLVQAKNIRLHFENLTVFGNFIDF